MNSPTPEEVIPYYVLRYSGVHLQFYTRPYPLSAFGSDDWRTYPKPDLTFSVATASGTKRLFAKATDI